jgi:hypothetical protein
MDPLQEDVRVLKEWEEKSRPSGWKSAIVPHFPELFEEFKKKQFTLLWRGSRDGFGAGDFHGRCDGHPNTLTVILDTEGNIFGGFTPVEWELESGHKADPSLKSFIFTLKNPHNVPPRRFALLPHRENLSMWCKRDHGPVFWDISVYDQCNVNKSLTDGFGFCYKNDTGLNGKTFFTGSQVYQVKEIEVFEITE